MNLAAALLLGHLIADFPLQTAWIYQYKTKSWVGVLLHSAIHVFVTACLVRPFHAVIPLLVLLGVLHFLTDFTKVRLPAKRQSPGFVIDQLVHLVVLFFLAQIWQNTLYSTLPATVLTPLLIYVTLLGIMIFLWVLACDLANSDWGHYSVVQWARSNLLRLSSYAGLPLFFYLFQGWSRDLQRPTSG